MFGGPVYFIGNILYHVPAGVAFKFSAKPAGLFVYHNTIIGEQMLRDPSSNMHFRNNLFLGRDTPDRGIMTWANATDAYSSDYNGFRPNKGVAEQYTWLAPRNPARRSTSHKPEDWKTFATLADFRAATGQETHGIEVDFDIFEKLAPPDPGPGRHAVYHAMDLNFRLKPAPRQWTRASFCPPSTTASPAAPRSGRPRTEPARAPVRPPLAYLEAVLPLTDSSGLTCFLRSR